MNLKNGKIIVTAGMILFLGYVNFPHAGSAGVIDRRIDSLEAHLPEFERKVQSTLMFGGSSPVSFSGEARLKIQYHDFSVFPEYLKNDKSYLQSGWEGNEGLVRLGMVARAGRNTVLWAKLGFQHTLPGNRWNTPPGDFGYGAAQGPHDKSNQPIYIHEDMCAGIAIRTRPASFLLKMGNVNWTEASPLTVWKAQPRLFAWEYLPFEIEQPVARYYEYNIARGEKSGRAAWHKKPFNGLNLESINLPFGLYANALYATFEAFDKGERESIDFSNDLAYADLAGPVKASGIGDSYRHLVHARIAAVKSLRDLTFGFNFNGITIDDDIAYALTFKKVFGIDSVKQNLFRVWYDANGDTLEIDTNRIIGAAFTGYEGRGFYREPVVYSIDVRGGITERVSLQADIALNKTDTTWIVYDSGFSYYTSTSPGAYIPAFYGNIGIDSRFPALFEAAVIPRGFNSPFSFAAPVDAFYAFGSNLLGAGKFIGSGETSPYVQNMAGGQLTLARKLSGYGHLKLKYGQHCQLEQARDLLFFPYRLNGQDLFTFFHSSYNRWGNDLVDHSIVGLSYDKRLGDESFYRTAYGIPVGPEGGGLRSNYLSMYEGFVAYENGEQADSNLANKTDLFTRSAFVPSHRKYTFNLELDGAWDIGPLLGYPRDFFLGGYAAINGVSTAFKALAFNDKDDNMLLWSLYLRFEPAIALTKKFYILGLAGMENWRSQKAYMKEPGAGARNVPIDFRDYALGLGFDWEMLERVGLHVRGKWMKHEDVNYRKNDWQTPVVSGEIKMWF